MKESTAAFKDTSKKLFKLLGKYKYVLPVIALGLIFLCLPVKKKTTAQPEAASYGDEEFFSLEKMEEKLENTLSRIQGAGRVEVLLTLASGSQIYLAENTERESSSGDGAEERSEKREVLTIQAGSSNQEAVVLKRSYPEYLGAVIVCDGASSSTVRLEITNAVSGLTGLSSDRITVCRMSSE